AQFWLVAQLWPGERERKPAGLRGDALGRRNRRSAFIRSALGFGFFALAAPGSATAARRGVDSLPVESAGHRCRHPASRARYAVGPQSAGAGPAWRPRNPRADRTV